MLAAAMTFLLLGVVLFTWFGRNWRALPALLQAVPHLLTRAGGEGHQKPFWYYAQLLTGGWSGGVILALACIGFFQTVKKRDPSPYGFLALYAFLLAGMYSLIPYKTPWLALNFWLPITLFAARAIGSLWRMAERHWVCALPFRLLPFLRALRCRFIAHDTRQRVFMHPADETNPYAYAHTSEDLLGLPAEIEESGTPECDRGTAHCGDRFRSVAAAMVLAALRASRLLAARTASGRSGFLYHFHRGC